MSFDINALTRYEKIEMVIFGIILAGLSFSYGVYSLIEGSCTVVGRGVPIGTSVTFYGAEARLLSSIYIGAGIWLFDGVYLNRLKRGNKSPMLSWVGAIALLFGICSLVVILSLPLFQQ